MLLISFTTTRYYLVAISRGTLSAAFLRSELVVRPSLVHLLCPWIHWCSRGSRRRRSLARFRVPCPNVLGAVPVVLGIVCLSTMPRPLAQTLHTQARTTLTDIGRRGTSTCRPLGCSRGPRRGTFCAGLRHRPLSCFTVGSLFRLLPGGENHQKLKSQLKNVRLTQIL